LHNEEFHDLNSLPHIIKVNQMSGDEIAGQVARTGHSKNINPYRVLVCKSEEKTPLERPASCWEDSTMNLGGTWTEFIFRRT
jgi:hypothetical protein